jgi:sugar phosphate isomerase/epimerase
MMTMPSVPVALQLYSVRDIAPADPAGTLANLAEMGFAGVEFAGYYGLSGQDLRHLLDAEGLQAAGAHVGLDSLLGDELEKSAEFHAALGNQHLVVPGLAPEYTSTIAGWKHAAELFNEIAERLFAYGMHTGYHNHFTEFGELEGEIPWQVLAENTRPEVILQLDTGNCAHGGGDPLAWLQRYPGRGRSIHLKPYSTAQQSFDTVIGEDDQDWPALQAAAGTVVGAKWCIIEQEEYPYGVLDSIRRDVDNYLALA